MTQKLGRGEGKRQPYQSQKSIQEAKDWVERRERIRAMYGVKLPEYTPMTTNKIDIIVADIEAKRPMEFKAPAPSSYDEEETSEAETEPTQ